jgi:putative SOS response-associated peptidase YedK
MCTNFLPAVQLKYLRSMFGVDIPDFEFHAEAYPGYGAPIVRNIIRRSNDEPPHRECIAARFGLVPSWSRPEEVEAPTRRFATHNARVETVGQLPSYKHAWHNSQRCLIPVEAFFEPCWETGKAVRWKMTLRDGHVFALAGIWERWYRDGKEVMSFSMLTVNADDHAIMKRMHRPGDEKRMPVIVRREDYDRWLSASPEEARRICQTFPAEEMIAEPAPKPARIPKPSPGPGDPELRD